MAHTFSAPDTANKTELYTLVCEQVEHLIADESDLIANLANITALLMQTFKHLWIGFYLRNKNDLVLGPFQGPLACTRIPIFPEPKGVCGKSAYDKQTIVVPDVNAFSGHIACSSESQSEIVVPLVYENITQLVLDVDSKEKNMFDEVDQQGLEKLIQIVQKHHFK